MRGLVATLLLLFLAGCGEQPAGEPIVRAELGDAVTVQETVPEPAATQASAAASACNPAEFEGIALTHCIADPGNPPDPDRPCPGERREFRYHRSMGRRFAMKAPLPSL